MFEIIRYNDIHREEWNRFVAASRQGTFLFDRGYMEYHSDRFRDASLVFRKQGNLYALLPANIDGDTLYSHQGLTYGGLLTTCKATAAEVCQLFDELNAWCHENGISHVVYKPMPWIYQKEPAEEDLYAITTVCQASLAKRNISTTIDLTNPVGWRYGRKYDARHALRNGVVTAREDDAIDEFWHLLDNNLESRYGKKPVHSLFELQLLHSRFPDNIRLYTSRKDGEMVAGSLVYITPQVVHTQYIASNAKGKVIHAVDALMMHLLKGEFDGFRYFDFGISNQDDLHWRLNEKLIFQKEGFGARAVVYDTYEWNI